MIDKAFAEHFAADWIASWNAHGLDRVLAHYADEFEMSSPNIVTVAGKPSGILRGKAAVRAYWVNALNLMPNLHYELVATLIGVNSINLYQRCSWSCGGSVSFQQGRQYCESLCTLL